jgi:heme/copper-type cytochrome/quinol oxidase subunit 2
MPLPLADAIFWVAAVCCVVAQWFIVRGALRAATATSATPAAARRWSDVVWAVVPAVALIAVLAATWRTLHRAPGRRSGPATPAAAAVASDEVLRHAGRAA